MRVAHHARTKPYVRVYAYGFHLGCVARSAASGTGALPNVHFRRRGVGGQRWKHTVLAVLNAIYEKDFKGFSYGLRRGRHPHQALDARISAAQV